MTTQAYTIIRRPLVTEKGNSLRETSNQYLFEVASAANKIQIRRAIESLFGVHVLDVRTQQVRGKWKRVGRHMGKRANWKKAFVSLAAGDKIELFEGV